VSVETQISAAHDELGWSPLPNVTTKLKPKASGSSIVWSEEIRLPKPPGLQPYRVVIREYELFASDADERTRRLVYADAVEIGGLRF
jgi:hypothetical protein